MDNNLERKHNENGLRARDRPGNLRQRKRLSGAARRIRQRQRASYAADRSGSGQDDKVPVGVPKKAKLSKKEPGSLSNEAFELVRQKLVASLMEVLPINVTAGNWNKNNSNALIPFNASRNQPSSWRGSNPQLNWNDNFIQSSGLWNHGMSGDGRNDNCPAPPAWGNNNQSVVSYDSMWGNGLVNPGCGQYEEEREGGEIKFAIVDMNQPKGKITGIRQNLLKNAFNEALADLILNSDNKIPPIQIRFSSFIADTYKVVVKSRRCAEVLQNLVDGLPAPWPGSKLRLVPLQGRVKLYRTSVYLRTGATGRSTEDILVILERQNSGLKTNRWSVFFRKEKEEAILLIIGIDRQTVEYLERNEGRVYFLTSTAMFRIGNDLNGRRRRRNSERPGDADTPEGAKGENRSRGGGRPIRQRRRGRRTDDREDKTEEIEL